MKILVSDKVSDQGVEILRKAHEVDVRHNLTPDELIEVIPQYDALVVRSETKATRKVIEAAANLKVIGRAGVGVDNIDLQMIKPYFELVEKMGTLAVYLAEGRSQALAVEYKGEISEVDSKMLTTATLKGVLNPILQEAVNYINAPMVARSHGIKIQELKSRETEHFANLISVRLKTDKGEHRVAGTFEHFSPRSELAFKPKKGYNVRKINNWSEGFATIIRNCRSSFILS